MAKRRKGSRKRSGGRRKVRRTRHAKKLSVATAAGAALTGYALLAPVYTQVKAKSYSGAASAAKTTATQWANYTPLIGGIVISMVGSKLGVNKYVARIPIVGKKIKL